MASGTGGERGRRSGGEANAGGSRSRGGASDDGRIVDFLGRKCRNRQRWLLRLACRICIEEAQPGGERRERSG